MFKNGLVLSYLKPLALGALAYVVVRQLTKKQATTSGFGADEGGNTIYARLEELRDQITETTGRYDELGKRAESLNLEIAMTSGGYEAAPTGQEKLQIRAKVVELLRERDQNMLEMGILARMLSSMRERIIAEDARLKSAVVAPIIAEQRTGMGEEPSGLYITPPEGTLPIPITPGFKDYKIPPKEREKRHEWKKAHHDLKVARAQLDHLKRRFSKKWGSL